MTADLGAFVRSMGREPFRWGQNDCALIIASWWQANHGIDPARHLRGAYSDEEGCSTLLKREGGLLRLVRKISGSVGAQAAEGKPGDFGVLRIEDKHLCGIRTRSGRWAMKGHDAVIVLKSPKIVKAWAI